jgi:hypothetical protein
VFISLWLLESPVWFGLGEGEGGREQKGLWFGLRISGWTGCVLLAEARRGLRKGMMVWNVRIVANRLRFGCES